MNNSRWYFYNNIPNYLCYGNSLYMDSCSIRRRRLIVTTNNRRIPLSMFLTGSCNIRYPNCFLGRKQRKHCLKTDMSLWKILLTAATENGATEDTHIQIPMHMV